MQGGGILDLGNQSNISWASNVTVVLSTLSNEFEELSANETTEIYFAGNDSTSTIDLTVSSGTYEPGANPNTEQGMTLYGALLNLTDVNLTSNLLIYYPLSQVFGNASIEGNLAPNLTLSTSSASVGSENFNFTVNINTSYFSKCAYRIVNTTNSSMAWNYSTGTQSFTRNFDSIYLPVGAWAVIVNTTDSFGNFESTNTTITSVSAIEASIIGSASGSGTIGGSDITFDFNIIAKGYPFVKFYMNLTSGSNTYNAINAKIGNSTSNQVNISGSPDYSNAQNFNVTSITGASLPDYALISSGIYYQNLTLYITPYSGMSAGTYTGPYGWGLFDS